MGRQRAATGLLLLLPVLLAGCGDEGRAPTYGVDPASLADLDGTFVSTDVEGRELVAGTEIQLTFDADAMSAMAGCNTMTGAFELDQEELAWSGTPGMTMMACEPDLAAQDEWLATLLTDGATIVSGDADLTLESGDVRIELDHE